MTENELSKVVLDAAFKVHTRIGPGILESIYEKVLARELQKRGVKVERQKPVHLTYHGRILEKPSDLIFWWRTSWWLSSNRWKNLLPFIVNRFCPNCALDIGDWAF